jgi:hypothetical protein
MAYGTDFALGIYRYLSMVSATIRCGKWFYHKDVDWIFQFKNKLRKFSQFIRIINRHYFTVCKQNRNITARRPNAWPLLTTRVWLPNVHILHFWRTKTEFYTINLDKNWQFLKSHAGVNLFI